MIREFRRSLYLILSGLMGLLMFFILHRILIFFYLLVSTTSDAYFPYERFVFWDYLSLVVALACGTVYGLWVGEYWYSAVYHDNAHGGLVDSINRMIWQDQVKSVEVKAYQHKLEAVAEKLENNLSTLENLVQEVPVPVLPVKSIKRTVSRRPVVKNVSKTTAVKRTRKKKTD